MMVTITSMMVTITSMMVTTTIVCIACEVAPTGGVLPTSAQTGILAGQLFIKDAPQCPHVVANVRQHHLHRLHLRPAVFQSPPLPFLVFLPLLPLKLQQVVEFAVELLAGVVLVV